MIGQYFYLFLVFPLAAAALCLLFRSKKELKTFISLGFSFLHFIVSLLILVSGEYGASIVAGDWPQGIGITLKFDLLSNLMMTVVSAIYFAGSLYFVKARTVEANQNFDFLFHTLFLGLSGAFLTHDLFNLFVWFEVTLMSSYVLVVSGQNLLRVKAGLKYIILNFISGMLFLLSVGLVYKFTKTLDFSELSIRLHSIYQTNPGVVRLLGLSLFGAFAIKSAFFPFFFWLPESYPKLSPGLSGVFAGLLTKLGLYAMIRIFGQVFPADQQLFNVFLILSVLSLLIGVWGAVVQTKIREILSYHVISQVGFIGIGVSFCMHPNIAIKKFAIAASIFYIIHHIIVKTNLFFIAGLIEMREKSEDLSTISGLFRAYPFLAVLFLIPAGSLIGVPPLSGFWAKLNLFKISIQARELWVVFAMIVGSFFTLFSMVKIWSAAFWGEVSEKQFDQTEKNKSMRPMLACIFLAVITLSLSVAPSWLQALVLEMAQ